MLELLVALVIYFLLLGAIVLFVVRLIQFIVCEDGFESENLKKKVMTPGIAAGVLVILGFLLRLRSTAPFWVG